jgi:hypothetical protein
LSEQNKVRVLLSSLNKDVDTTSCARDEEKMSKVEEPFTRLFEKLSVIRGKENQHATLEIDLFKTAVIKRIIAVKTPCIVEGSVAHGWVFGTLNKGELVEFREQ